MHNLRSFVSKKKINLQKATGSLRLPRYQWSIKTVKLLHLLKLCFIINGAKLASQSPVPTGQGKEFCEIKCTNIKILYTILSGRGKKTTSAIDYFWKPLWAFFSKSQFLYNKIKINNYQWNNFDSFSKWNLDVFFFANKTLQITKNSSYLI